MTFHIERAHVRDLTKVKPLWKAMIHHYATITDGLWAVREPTEAWQRRHQEYLNWINDATGVIFLAVQDEEVIGYAALHLIESGATFDFGEKFGDIETLAVAPEHRDRGVGSALVAACREELERREIAYWTMISLASNEGAVRLAERSGFKPFMVRMVQRLDLSKD